MPVSLLGRDKTMIFITARWCKWIMLHSANYLEPGSCGQDLSSLLQKRTVRICALGFRECTHGIVHSHFQINLMTTASNKSFCTERRMSSFWPAMVWKVSYKISKGGCYIACYQACRPDVIRASFGVTYAAISAVSWNKPVQLVVCKPKNELKVVWHTDRALYIQKGK